MNIQQQGQYQEYPGNHQQHQEGYNQHDYQGNLELQGSGEYYEEYSANQGGYSHQDNQGYQYLQQDYQGDQNYYDDPAYQDGQGYQNDQGYQGDGQYVDYQQQQYPQDQYDQYQQQYQYQDQQGNDPFNQFEDGGDMGGEDDSPEALFQQKKDAADDFDLKKERSILNRIFQQKGPNQDISKLKAMEALSEKHKNVDTWLHTTLANNPKMVTMNKFVQLGLVKSRPTAPQNPNPKNKGPRENPFKLGGNTELKSIDPKHFLEVKSYYYTNLFEEVLFLFGEYRFNSQIGSNGFAEYSG